MNGKKLRKIALITAAILAGLFVTLIVVAKLVITPERVRRTVLPMAEKALHRPVTIGDIRVSIFSGIVLDKLTIGEEQGTAPFVTAERVKLSYRFWPLLRGEVVVNEVELVAPLVRIVRRADGSFNFSDLAAPKEKPAQAETEAPPATGKGIDLRVATFTLSKGTIIYEAAAAKGGAPFRLTVADIHVEATDFALDRPFSVKLSAQLPVAKVAVAGSVNLAGGTSIDLEAKVMDADLARLATLLPPEQATSLRPLNLAGILNLRLKLAGPVSAGMGLVKDGELRLANLQATAGGLRPDISGTIQIAGRRVAAKELTLVVADNRLAIDFVVPDLTVKPTRLTCNVAASTLSVDKILAITGGKSGESSAAHPKSDGKPASEPGPVIIPLTADGTIRADVMIYKGLKVEETTLRYRLADSVLTIDNLSGKVAGGTFKTDARVDLKRPGFTYATKLNVQGVQADTFIAAFAPRFGGTLFGTLALTADITGSGTQPEALKKNLAGSGTFAVTNGRLTGAGLIQGMAQFLKNEQLRVLSFTRFAGTYTVKNGDILVDSAVEGKDVRLRPKGVVGLDQAINLSLETHLSPELTRQMAGGDLNRYLTDKEGWGYLPLTVTGSTTSPHFGLDSRLVREQAKDKAREQVQKELERKLLRGKPGEKKRPEQELIEQGLKGLLGR